VNVTTSGPGAVRSSPSGIDCGATCSATFTDGTVVTIAAHADSGATFTGWKGACSGTGDCIVTVSGDVAVVATFEAVPPPPPPPPPPPDECAALRPSLPGAAPHSYTIPMPTDLTGVACQPAESDGSGTLALVLALIHGGDTADFVSSSSGERIGQGGAVGALFGRLSGFVGQHFAGGGEQWLSARDTNGNLFAQTKHSGHSLSVVVDDPVGGVVVPVDFGAAGVESYDDHLNLRWKAPPPGRQMAFGVDRAGRTLILFNGDDRYGMNTVAGVWLDEQGTAGPVFQAFGPQPGVVGFGLEPRVGSGLFIRAGTATGPSWVGQIDSLATSVSPPPAWLQARPGALFHMVHNGTGYAVLPPGAGASADCSQTIEVLGPSGTSCGTATFSAGSGSCNLNYIVIGYDGTVTQSLPTSKEKQCVWGACSCTWQWWPGFFR
jgi:hypothetical protein